MNDKKVLIVDFDAESLVSMSNLVYEEGFQAETATDGLAAYEKFRSGQFSLVILEPMLPKLHGYELCKRIVNDPERRVPVIIVTAIYREPSCRHDALTVNGAAAFFTKPYNREELRSKILQLLVEGQERSEKEAEAPAAAPAPPKAQAPVQAAFYPSNTKSYKLELKDLLETAPAHRETRSAKPAVDIEKELQDAVSGLVGTSRKKETVVRKEPDALAVKDEFRQLREKREIKTHEDRDIDSLLKDAIGGLAVPPNKVADPPRRDPVVRPVPPANPETRTHQVEKIPVAEEIKRHLPFQPGKANNVPHAASRAEISRTAVPFDIDRTLIEIDQIPIGDAKPAREEEKDAAALPGVKKIAIFEEFEEPAKRKPKTAVFGAAAGVLSWRRRPASWSLNPKERPVPFGECGGGRGVTGGGNGLTAAGREILSGYRRAELRSEPKRVVRPAPEKPVEIGAPIRPDASTEGRLTEIRENPAANPPAASETLSEAVLPTQSALDIPREPEPKPQETPSGSGAPQIGEPADAQSAPGRAC